MNYMTKTLPAFFLLWLQGLELFLGYSWLGGNLGLFLWGSRVALIRGDGEIAKRHAPAQQPLPDLQRSWLRFGYGAFFCRPRRLAWVCHVLWGSRSLAFSPHFEYNFRHSHTI
jgi:hypothetical protein